MEAAFEILTKAIDSRAKEFGWSFTRVPGAAVWLEVGPHRVLLLPLPEDLAVAEEAVDEGKETAFDQWVTAGEARVVNIAMFCVAPPGTQHRPEWVILAGKVERDDMVCRKLVWLPSNDHDNVDSFLDRTFFARPWDQAMHQGPEALAVLAESLDVPTEWMARLMDTDLEGADLLHALLEIAEGEP
jgi:hypothetical protein